MNIDANDITLIADIKSIGSNSYTFIEPLTHFRQVAFALTAGYSRCNIFPVNSLLATFKLGISLPLNFSFKQNYEAFCIISFSPSLGSFAFLEGTTDFKGWTFDSFKVYGIGRIL